VIATVLGDFIIFEASGAPKGGGVAGLHSPLPIRQNRNLKKADFVGIMISKVFHGFRCSRNKPLTSADD
jgi:hypothetical protein